MAGEKIDIKRIKEAREAKGISVYEMSKALGYKSYVAYYRKEEGTRKFNTSDVAGISKILGLELDDIFLNDKLPQR
ncbi:helix-turn-helix domain-containing protein [Salinicoccus sp. Marseille-QA3877]